MRATHRLASRGRGNRDRGSDAQKAHRLPGESQDPWHHRLELLERSYGLPNDDRLVRRNDGPRLSPGVRAVSVFPAIVDPELFRAAQARLAMRNRHPRSERALPQLFVGLWYGGQAIPRKPHHSSGERTNRGRLLGDARRIKPLRHASILRAWSSPYGSGTGRHRQTFRWCRPG